MAVINPVSTRAQFVLNVTVPGGTESKNVYLSNVDTAITAAKLAAVVTAFTPLFAYDIVSTKKLDTSLLVNE